MTDKDTFSCLYLPLGNNMKISKKGRLVLHGPWKEGRHLFYFYE